MKTTVLFSLLTGILTSYVGYQYHDLTGFFFGFFFILIALAASGFRFNSR